MIFSPPPKVILPEIVENRNIAQIKAGFIADLSMQHLSTQATAAQHTREQGAPFRGSLSSRPDSRNHCPAAAAEDRAPCAARVDVKLSRSAVESRGQMASILTNISGGTYLIIKSSIKIGF